MTYPQPARPTVPGLHPPVSAPLGTHPPGPVMPNQAGHPQGPQRVTGQPALASSLAAASLVLGILGVLGGWYPFGPPCILAVMVGHLVLRETRDGRRSGHGMAVAATPTL